MAAIAAVGTVRAAILSGLTEQGAVLLGGDAQMEFTYRFASDEERTFMIAKALAVSEVVDEGQNDKMGTGIRAAIRGW